MRAKIILGRQYFGVMSQKTNPPLHFCMFVIL